jgi:hypothetical protein
MIPSETEPAAPAETGVQKAPRRRRLLIPALAAALSLALALAGWGGWYFFGKRVLAPSGGIYYPGRFALDVPLYLQGDPKWGHDYLAWAPRTLGQVGCAVSSAAMVMQYYGIDTDPGRLNIFLRANGGYDENNDLLWPGPAALAPDRVRHVYEDLPSYYLIDSNLLRGNPVIIRLRLPSGWTHFVVIMGKQGFDYLIRDPSSAGLRKGIYPLRELGRPMEALRYYEKLPKRG